MMYNSYDEMIQDILKKSNDEEKSIITKEDELFKNRKWEKYILAVVNFFNDAHVENFESDISFGGSATDSYIIQKATGFISRMIGNPCRQRSREILFNDALRVFCEVHTGFLKMEELKKIYNQLSTFLTNYDLNYKHVVIPNNYGSHYGIASKTAEVFIISNNDIPSEYVDIVKNERYVEETEDERSILRGLMLVYFSTISGL